MLRTAPNLLDIDGLRMGIRLCVFEECGSRQMILSIEQLGVKAKSPLVL